MSNSAILGLLIYILGLVAGQMLFKLASASIDNAGTSRDLVVSIVGNPMLWVAGALYFALSVYWVWLLSFTPMSRAYPFQALAFVLIPLAGVVLFSEPFTLRLGIGIAVIVAGVVIVSG